MERPQAWTALAVERRGAWRIPWNSTSRTLGSLLCTELRHKPIGNSPQLKNKLIRCSLELRTSVKLEYNESHLLINIRLETKIFILEISSIKGLPCLYEQQRVTMPAVSLAATSVSFPPRFL